MLRVPRQAARTIARRLFSTCQETTTSIAKKQGGPFGDGGTVSGFAAPGWEGVREAFEVNFSESLELGAQLSIVKDEEVVVDLAGFSSKQPGYSAETLQCVFSSGKNMEAISAAMLVDRGLLKYSDKVSDHWPEFAQHGKGDITVADVLRHESGLSCFPFPDKPDDIAGGTVVTPEVVADPEALSKVIEESGLVCAPGTRIYHAITRGWIVSMLMRRVDPEGRTLGQFIRDEISGPLELTYYCGMTDEEQAQHDFADMTQIPMPYNLMFEVLPAMLGMGSPQLKGALDLFGDKTNPLLRPVCDWMVQPPTPAFNNTPEGRGLEICSAGCHTNARSMAKINACMASGGALGGVRIMSEEACAASMAEVKTGHDAALNLTMGFTQGGFGDMGSPDSPLYFPDTISPGFFGWGGWGGSLSFIHPGQKVGLSYTMNGMSNYLVSGPRTDRILVEARKVLDAL